MFHAEAVEGDFEHRPAFRRIQGTTRELQVLDGRAVVGQEDVAVVLLGVNLDVVVVTVEVRRRDLDPTVQGAKDGLVLEPADIFFDQVVDFLHLPALHNSKKISPDTTPEIQAKIDPKFRAFFTPFFPKFLSGFFAHLRPHFQGPNSGAFQDDLRDHISPSHLTQFTSFRTVPKKPTPSSKI